MRLGIDLGTTRTVVATADRGNYPVLTFTDADGDAHEHLPSVVARLDGDLVYGFEALAAAADGAELVRSFKRRLGDPDVTVDSTLEVGGATVRVVDLVAGFLRHLAAAVRTESGSDEPLQAVVSVPAHAHTTQRFLTLEAFREAGFEVLALVNEPSAAGFEFTHRQTRSLSSRRTQVLVYDLGGGTFDASLVEADGDRHEVLGSIGVNRLGGDDFDVVLAETARRVAGPDVDLSRSQWRRLVEDARDAKERLTPQTRRVVLEVAGQDVVVAVEDFYEAAAPLVEQSITAMEPLVGQLDDSSISATLSQVAGMYLVGGGSGLPLVARALRERFGRRVHRSPYPAAATAIGLAIAADPDSTFTLHDRFSRGFGVFRERDGGRSLGFDELVAPQVEVPSDAVLEVVRRYRPAHDLGVYRFVEYLGTDEAGDPRGEIVPFAQVHMPFTAELQQLADAELALREVHHLPEGELAGLVEERYSVGADGRVSFVITDTATGYSRSFGS